LRREASVKLSALTFLIVGTMVLSTSVIGIDMGENPSSNEGPWVKQGMVMDDSGFALGVKYPYVLYHEGIYKMWYSGIYSSLDGEIFYATSPDGVTWTDHGCVLPKPPGTSYVVVPSVLIEGDGTYKMWFSCHDGSYRSRTYLATSNDGINWVNQGLVVDRGPPGSPDSVYVVHAKVFKDGSLYKMYYKAYDDNTVSSIMYATSTDGYSWTKHGVVVDQPPGFTNIGCPLVVKNSPDNYTMWYYGAQGGVIEIYVAYSTDGLTWTPGTLDLAVGAPGELDDEWVFGPSIVIDPVTGNELMYYSGCDGSKTRIFLAEREEAGGSPTVDLSIYDVDISASNGNPGEGETISISATIHGDPGSVQNGSGFITVFSDDFDSEAVGTSLPANWNMDTNFIYQTVEVDDSIAHSNPNSMLLRSKSTNSGRVYADAFGPSSDLTELSCWFYIPDDSRYYAFHVQSTSMNLNWEDILAQIGFDDKNGFVGGVPHGIIYTIDPTPFTQVGHTNGTWAPNIWFKMTVIFDFNNYTFDIFKDGIQILDDCDFFSQQPYLRSLGFYVVAGSNVMWVDDIEVKTYTETTENIYHNATCTVSYYLDSIAEANLIDRQYNVFVPGQGETTVTTNWIAEIPGSHDIIIEVSDVDPPDSDLSNNVASIAIFVENSGTETATATGPQGAHHDPVIEITYDWTETPSAVDLYYSLNAGDTWNYLGTDYSVDGSYYWSPNANPGPKPSKYYWIANAKNGADDVGIPADGTPPEAGPFNWKCWDTCENAPTPLSGSASNWFFVSVPLDISGDLLTVFDDAEYGDGGTTWDYIQWYDASDPSDPWKSYSIYRPTSLNDDVIVDNTMGFWIHLTSNLGDGVLTAGEGTDPVSTTIVLHAGWNLVGYPTLTEGVTISDAFWGSGVDQVDVFDPSDPYMVAQASPSYIMQPGEGYWVHVNSDTTWTVDW